ncbi:hypothetical protein SADUNF_Sadunf15G0032600 [Salix dunnii]|uniref:RanBP2-type domain-containing protein n=1 Tax=Salix dunnii TaxID=1413687 RepID=A0A835JFQ7_9ROSI|nr:hypothetical protein SADUNF_Sadunf15G0032600 [Salix dunnii]
MSSASRFVLFGTSLFHRATHNSHPHQILPPFFSLKTFPSLQFHLYCSSTAPTAATDTTDITETLNSLLQERKQKQHPWPEWVIFVDKLKARGYFMQTSTKEEDGDATSETAYTDMNQLKNACLSFARDRYDIFKSLSIPDIQTVVESGCPNLLRKAVNSAKRMRAYVQKDEGDACGTCTHRGVCDRAYVILKGNDAEGRTVDIVRVLMFHALDPSVIIGGQRSTGSELIETSARKLLSELIELSETPQDPALPKHTPKASHKKERDVDFMDGQLCENVEMKKEDWMCIKYCLDLDVNFLVVESLISKDQEELVKGWKEQDSFLLCHSHASIVVAVGKDAALCNFMNFSKNKRCQKCGEQSAKKDGDNNIEAKKGDWICSECKFMNFSRNIKCLKCKAVGPKRPGVDDVEMKKGDWNCNSCGFMNFASNKTCLRCRDPRPEIKTGEWNCPSCDFLNFSRNKVCLKCNCVSPKRMAGEWHCPSCDFLNFNRNKDCLKCKCKRPKEATTEYEEQIWKHPY